MKRLGLAILAGALLAAVPAAAQVTQSFDIQTPFAPTLADAEGTPQLAYEIHLTSFAGRPVMIDRIALIDAASGAEIAGAGGDALAGWIGRTGPGDTDPRLVAPGERALIYVNLALGSRPAPAAIRHRIHFHFPAGPVAGPAQVTGTAVAIDRRPLPVLGPPLRGGPWAAVYEPGMERGHRRVVYATEGAARIPGRFAIDWFGLDEQGRTARGDGSRVDAHFGYGAEVLAVADGIVAAVRDDMSEPELTADAPAVAIGDATGNYVAIDLGGGRFAFYEHLKPGIGVRVGDRVRRGQMIGRLGFTGQASSPHLHFHLADANSPLGAEGTPYVMAGIRIAGSYPSIAAFARGGPWDTPRAPGQASAPIFPGANAIVHFPTR